MSLFKVYILHIEGHTVFRFSARNSFVLHRHANFRILVSRHEKRASPGFMMFMFIMPICKYEII